MIPEDIVMIIVNSLLDRVLDSHGEGPSDSPADGNIWVN